MNSAASRGEKCRPMETRGSLIWYPLENPAGIRFTNSTRPRIKRWKLQECVLEVYIWPPSQNCSVGEYGSTDFEFTTSTTVFSTGSAPCGPLNAHVLPRKTMENPVAGINVIIFCLKTIRSCFRADWLGGCDWRFGSLGGVERDSIFFLSVGDAPHIGQDVQCAMCSISAIGHNVTCNVMCRVLKSHMQMLEEGPA